MSVGAEVVLHFLETDHFIDRRIVAICFNLFERTSTT